MKTFVFIYFKFNKLRNISFIEYFFMKIEIPNSGHILYALSCILGFRGGFGGPDLGDTLYLWKASKESSMSESLSGCSPLKVTKRRSQ